MRWAFIGLFGSARENGIDERSLLIEQVHHVPLWLAGCTSIRQRSAEMSEEASLRAVISLFGVRWRTLMYLIYASQPLARFSHAHGRDAQHGRSCRGTAAASTIRIVPSTYRPRGR